MELMNLKVGTSPSVGYIGDNDAYSEIGGGMNHHLDDSILTDMSMG